MQQECVCRVASRRQGRSQHRRTRWPLHARPARNHAVLPCRWPLHAPSTQPRCAAVQVIGNQHEASRLLLAEATAETMRACFKLLGITPLYRI